MSGYHYNDRMENRNSYKKRDELTHYNCDVKCLCRWGNERSVKDRMMISVYNNGKKMFTHQGNNTISKNTFPSNCK